MTANVRPAATLLQSCCVDAELYEFCNHHPRARMVLFTLDFTDAEPFVGWFRQLGLEEAHAQVAGQDLLNELLAVDWLTTGA